MRTSPGPLKNQIVLIVVLLGALVGVIVFQDRCARGVGNLFNVVDVRVDGGRRD